MCWISAHVVKHVAPDRTTVQSGEERNVCNARAYAKFTTKALLLEVNVQIVACCVVCVSIEKTRAGSHDLF